MLVNTSESIWNPTTAYLSEAIEYLNRIYVKDAQTLLPVPISALLGYNEDLIQTVAVSTSPLNFSVVTPFTTTSGETSNITTARMSILCIGSYFSVASSTVNFTVVVTSVDSIQIPIYSGTLEATNIVINESYTSILRKINLDGAYEVKVIYEAPSSGSVSIIVGAV